MGGGKGGVANSERTLLVDLPYSLVVLGPKALYRIYLTHRE